MVKPVSLVHNVEIVRNSPLRIVQLLLYFGQSTNIKRTESIDRIEWSFSLENQFTIISSINA